MIWYTFFAQLVLIVFSYLAISAVPAPFYLGQDALVSVLGQVPRIAVAGLITFLVSETLDAYIFDWFKRLTEGRKLWMRNVFSTLPSMAVDSVLFVTLAFYGVLPIAPLIIGLIVVKWFVGVIDIPFMYLSRYILGGSKDSIVKSTLK